MRNRYLVIGALSAVLGLSGMVAYQKRTIDAQQAEIASLTRSVAALTMQAEQSALARDVERARAAREATRSAELAAEIETILTGGIPDAPLHPDLADLVNRRVPDDD
jgi:predicted negative regulator of RcsB-dependent stress response